MCKLTLNAVVTRALMDEHFCQALLAGRTDQVLREFPLGEEERQVLEQARAATLDGFVAQVHALMHQQLPEASPPAGVSAVWAYEAVGGA